MFLFADSVKCGVCGVAGVRAAVPGGAAEEEGC